MVGLVGAHRDEQCDGVPVGLVPPALVGGGQEHLDGVGAALRKGTVEVLWVPALGLCLLPCQVYQQGLQQDKLELVTTKLPMSKEPN